MENFRTMESTAVFTNDAVVLGILLLLLAVIFATSGLNNDGFKRFYTFVPPLLLCYLLPGVLNSLGIIDGEKSNLYFVASRYLLPASLALLCLSIDLKGILKLGWRALAMFFAGTLGIIIGGPLALWLVSLLSPDVLVDAGADSVWKGLATVAGSWIGGGANQTAMKEIYGASDNLFAAMVIVDVVVANLWMAFLLFGAGRAARLDRWLKADSSAITELRSSLEDYQATNKRVATTTDLFVILAIGFGATAVAHFSADILVPYFQGYEQTLTDLGLTSLLSGFFWIVVVATAVGVALSFSKLRSYEGAGASKFGSVFIYVLVATIGMKIDIGEMIANWSVFKYLIAAGLIWISVHILVLLLVAKLIRAPFFFVAVGSQANVGGAASAPVVASAFSPALAPVGVLIAVLGYAVGTYGAILCAEMMGWISM